MKLRGPEIITNLPIPLNELTETILFSSARIFKFERLSSLDSLASWEFLALLSLEYRNAYIATAPKSTPRLVKMSGTSEDLEAFARAPINCVSAISPHSEPLAMKAR